LNYIYSIIDLRPKGKNKMSAPVTKDKAYAKVAWMRLGELLEGYDDRYGAAIDDLTRGFGSGNKFVAELKKIEQRRHTLPKFETNSVLEELRDAVLAASK
jgi:hypothetical protein